MVKITRIKKMAGYQVDKIAFGVSSGFIVVRLLRVMMQDYCNVKFIRQPRVERAFDKLAFESFLTKEVGSFSE
jgi:hypothetical protein